ncbi:MAG: AMP-binding protein, partial [Gammaproteobacteria bacterium]|nr:AMP-binding protein [Gammaproteobacteria bacterium]
MTTPDPGRSGEPSYCHLGGVEPLLGATLPAHLWSVAAARADAPAVISRHQARRLSYGELMAAADRLALGLLGLGFARGDRIGVWSTNNVEWLLLQLATARIGAVLVNINPAYRPRELAYALERAGVQGLFLVPAFRHSDYVAMLAGEVPELGTAPGGRWRSARLPELRRVVLFDPRDPDPARPAPGIDLWREVLEAGGGVGAEALEAATAELDRDDPINIQFTSGTTGFPKAVLLSHHNLLNNAWFSARLLGFTPADRLCVPVPFYHCFGMVLSNLLCLASGAALVLPAEHFDAGACLDAIAAEGCTAVHGVPTMFIALLEAQAEQPRAVESLRTGIMAGAPCP